MGQAFDQDGRVLSEAFGKTKKEVFDKLNEQSPSAASMMIRTLQGQVDEAMAESPGDEERPSGGVFLGKPMDEVATRELAKQMLARRVMELEEKLKGVKHLLAIVEHLEADSPAERLIWSLLTAHRSRW
jgi:hypothetical protein